ncbi:hypothetical protein NH340_JMT04601 [Sarcoptes scabiei]|uniref:Checkpoint protein n=1 Tax=Sarcoptes scabiei TaxID=52283 RepID=A0A834VBC5_SARSC|nr:hypothetical protein NH340_JMT04601 [Sarcoptes scabiei]
MKFRAHSNNFEAIQNILKSFQAASRLSNSIVFKISTTSIQLITNPSARSHHLLSRCELIRSLLFDEYVLKGFSEQDNFIYFDVRSDTLSQVLHSLQNNLKSLKLKLMNGSKGRFVLSITAEYPTFKADRIIRYQVYIDILNRNIWNSLDEYRLDPINVSLILPPFKQISSAIESLSSMSQYAIFSSKVINPSKAYVAIGVCSDSMIIKSKFSDLEIYSQKQVNSENNSAFADQCIYKARIDIRRLNQALIALANFKPTAIIFQISNEKAICMHFFNDMANFKIILPHFDV